MCAQGVTSFLPFGKHLGNVHLSSSLPPTTTLRALLPLHSLATLPWGFAALGTGHLLHLHPLTTSTTAQERYLHAEHVQQYDLQGVKFRITVPLNQQISVLLSYLPPRLTFPSPLLQNSRPPCTSLPAFRFFPARGNTGIFLQTSFSRAFGGLTCCMHTDWPRKIENPKSKSATLIGYPFAVHAAY